MGPCVAVRIVAQISSWSNARYKGVTLSYNNTVIILIILFIVNRCCHAV